MASSQTNPSAASVLHGETPLQKYQAVFIMLSFAVMGWFSFRAIFSQAPGVAVQAEHGRVVEDGVTFDIGTDATGPDQQYVVFGEPQPALPVGESSNGAAASLDFEAIGATNVGDDRLALIRDGLQLSQNGSSLFEVSSVQIHERSRFVVACADDANPQALSCVTDEGLQVFQIDMQILQPLEIVSSAHALLARQYADLDTETQTRVQAAVADWSDDNPLTAVRIGLNRDETTHASAYASVGVSIVDVPAMLDDQYREILRDRQAVVTINETMMAQFDELDARIAVLEDELVAKKALAEELDAAIVTNEPVLRELRVAVDALAADSPAHSQAVVDYNDAVATHTDVQDDYSETVTSHNALVSDLGELIGTRQEMTFAITPGQIEL